jgi:hypothetical protein
MPAGLLPDGWVAALLAKKREALALRSSSYKVERGDETSRNQRTQKKVSLSSPVTMDPNGLVLQ